MLDHFDQVTNWAQGLNQEVSWPALRYHLKATDKKAFEALNKIEFIDGKSSEDLRIAKRAGGFAYEFWCQGGDLKDIDHLLDCFSKKLESSHETIGMTDVDESVERSKERVQSAISRNAERVASNTTRNEIWALPISDRQRLLQKWKKEINPWTVVDQTAEVYRRYLTAAAQKTANRDEMYLKCLSERRSPGFKGNLPILSLTRGSYWHDHNRMRQELGYVEEIGYQDCDL